MSLHNQAKHLASKGRGPDTTMVHMSAGEVAGLEALARRHYGKGLTTNPDTGLPEAGILSSILPVIAGIALTATGVGAPLAAAMVGGGTALATGSLQQGLMAGLGAFGGAGMGSALSGMGTAAAAAAPSAAAQTAASGMTASEAATAFADPAIAGMETASPGFESMASQSTAYTPFEAGFTNTGAAADASAMSGANGMSGWDKLSGGIKDLTQPGGFDRFTSAQGGHAGRNAMMAGYPLMGALGKKKPFEDDSDAQIRPYSYDQGSQSFTAGTPYSAKDAKTRFADGGIAGLMDTGSDEQRALDTVKRTMFSGMPMPEPGAMKQYNYNPATQQFSQPGAALPPDSFGGGADGSPSPQEVSAGGGGPAGGEGGVGDGSDSAGGSPGDWAAGGSIPGHTGISGLLRGPGDGVSDSIPATINGKSPARLGDGEFVVPARIVSEIGNGSTDAGARKLYAMMDRVQNQRGKTTGKGRVAVKSGADRMLPA